ncbi:MAG: adenylyltransferase/cytidyltransferase family protein [Dehalococcoidales bacterium]|jgi:D-beta-D-heptose 7-phosphate kinase/D-beta-D-heptose 1-phosphate adenosyltransferase|nr:adenylyltransferase/cytidyltransferase family protein [Dehalococcoidales bacterium]
MGKIVVAIAGGFDPIHRGHVDHIQKAKALGDELVVITHADEVIRKKKGYCLMPLQDRVAVLRAIKYVDRVVVSLLDNDGLVAETLRLIKPDIFAKGGDRIPGNMPDKEVRVCQECGIRIIYGIGDLLNSSSDLVRRAAAEVCAVERIKTGV